MLEELQVKERKLDEMLHSSGSVNIRGLFYMRVTVCHSVVKNPKYTKHSSYYHNVFINKHHVELSMMIIYRICVLDVFICLFIITPLNVCGLF